MLRKKVLEILSDNCLITPEQIAIMLNTELKQIQNEIKILEEEKVILKYGALVNWEKANIDVVSALIEVKVVPQRDVGFDQLAERIYRFPEVKSVLLVSGTYDLSVVIEGKTMKEVALFVAEKLASLEHVQSTVTHFVLKTYKQDGVIFEDKEIDRRQVITP
jgi:DNA-binding Lrp family transcriptional regulator